MKLIYKMLLNWSIMLLFTAIGLGTLLYTGFALLSFRLEPNEGPYIMLNFIFMVLAMVSVAYSVFKSNVLVNDYLFPDEVENKNIKVED